MEGSSILLEMEISWLFARKNLVYSKTDVDHNLISKMELEDFLKEGVGVEDVSELWFCKSGLKLHDGIQEIKCGAYILKFCSTGKETLDVYVIQGKNNDESPTSFIDFNNK